MIESPTTDRSGRLIALFPQLLGVGGVQEAGRLTAWALSDICRRRRWLLHALSLNDPPGVHVAPIGEQEVGFQGFGRAKLGFALSAMRRARQPASSRTLLVLAAHPNLAPLGAWLRRVCPGSKTMVMAHGIEVWEPLASLRRRALCRANMVLAPSHYTAQRLADVQGVSQDRIHTLPWPLSPHFVRMAADPADLPLPGCFPTGRVVLTVGRWSVSERYKGTDDLIRAVAQLCPHLPELQLAVVGGGDDLARLRELAVTLKIPDRVHFFTDLSREQIAACYHRADVFVLPSTGEGFGLVFLEAMAFAKPVVAVRFGGTTDIVQEGFNGLLVSPRNAKQLANALDRLLRDTALGARLGRNGAEMIQQKYLFNVFEGELERMLAKVGVPEPFREQIK